MGKSKLEREMDAAAEAQILYAKKKGTPLFAPRNGVCYCCGRNIYYNKDIRERAGKELITGCIFCHATFCD